MSNTQNKQALRPDGRAQPRVRAQVPIRVGAPGGGSMQRALLMNLSWGGAEFRCDEAPGAAGATLQLELPYHAEPIHIGSEILRLSTGDDGGCTVAVRFSSLSPAAEEHLEKVLEMLLTGSGGGRREHPRLAQRLEVYFDDPADIRATLEDISQGGLAVTVPYSFSPDQSVQLTVFGGPRVGELRLRARVVRQTEVADGKLRLYNVGLKFEHPTGDLQDLVAGLLKKLTSREALAARKWKVE